MADFNATDPSTWTAGDGYAVTSDYLSNLPDYSSGGGAGMTAGVAAPTSNTPGSQSFNMLDYAASQSPNMYYNSGSNTLGTLGATLGGTSGGAWGNAASTVLGDYNNASTDTGSSVLSGAASGAIAGTMIMPGIGTVIGGVLGGIAGFFGSKSKKKQANQQFQQELALRTAPAMQEQANYLQKQKLTQAAISPYGAAYQPNGFQFKNNLLKGGQPLAQPQQGQLNIPNAPPSITSPGLGKPLTSNIPGASFTPSGGLPSASAPVAAPSTTFQPQQPVAPMVPKYTGNKAQDQAALNQYATQYGQNLYQQDQLAAAQAMNPYSPYFNGGAI